MSLSILNIEDKCTGCGACVNICPRQCLRLSPNAEGFYYPTYDAQNCIECHLCEKACKEVTPQESHDISREYIYIYHTANEELREKSTSGGAFTSFANRVLNEGGIVFATRFNAETGTVEVSHTDANDIDSFRKSKYVESFMGDAMQQIKENLKKNRQVLFCGTPCQVAGLKTYLQTSNVSTEHLLTIDFLCHGIPSMKCLRAFLDFEESGKKKVVDVDFRYKDFSNKKIGWHNMVYCEYFDNGKKKVLKRWDRRYYYYYIPFLEDRSLRKSCYTCNQVIHSCADITVGDFWGINKYKKIKDDNKGLSFVLFHNKQLEESWLQDNGSSFIEKIPFTPVEKHYVELDRTAKLPRRNDFYQQILSDGYMKTVKRIYHPQFIKDWRKRLFRF